MLPLHRVTATIFLNVHTGRCISSEQPPPPPTHPCHPRRAATHGFFDNPSNRLRVTSGRMQRTGRKHYPRTCVIIRARDSRMFRAFGLLTLQDIRLISDKIPFIRYHRIRIFLVHFWNDVPYFLFFFRFEGIFLAFSKVIFSEFKITFFLHFERIL